MPFGMTTVEEWVNGSSASRVASISETQMMLADRLKMRVAIG